jgi:hypothetical protein
MAQPFAKPCSRGVIAAAPIPKPHHGRAAESAAIFSERRRAARVMDRNFDDIADKIGRRVATVFIVLPYALFADGYLRPLF